MADYQLTNDDYVVIRTADRAFIPNDPENRDRIEYDKWLYDGGVPDPYAPPPPTGPAPTEAQEALFDHENRLRALEGTEPMAREEFIEKLKV